MDLKFRFKKAIITHSMVEEGDRILLAVSGGVDSCVMLNLFMSVKDELGLELSVGHVNHCLRGRESDMDELFVKRLSKRCGLDFSVERVNCRKKGGNIQDVAREKRYKALEKMAGSLGANKIALAHNKDDQAETIIMNLVRGCGLDGLCGMPLVRGGESGISIIRPMITFSRSEIEAFAKENSVEYREDSSNSSAKYFRNRIRNFIIPELKKINPRLVDHIYKTARCLSEDEDVLNGLAGNILNSISMREENGLLIRWERLKFMSQPKAIRRRIVRCAYGVLTGGTKDLKSDHVERIDQIALSPKPSGRYELPHGVRFSRERDDLYLRGRFPHLNTM